MPPRTLPSRRYAHDSSDWYTVGVGNTQEFNARARWTLKFDPSDAQQYQGLVDPLDNLSTDDAAAASRRGVAGGSSSSAVAGNASGDGSMQRCHVRRKHRRDCPKHALNEERRSTHHDVRSSHTAAAGGATSDTSLQGPTDSQEVDSKGRPWLLEPKPKLAYPTLAVPRGVGRGFATFIMGSYDPHVAKPDEKRWLRDYPDFRTKAKVVLPNPLPKTFDHRVVQTVDELPGNVSAARAERAVERHPNRVVIQPLVHPYLDKEHTRRKYELKAQMEYEFSIGKSLQRAL